jgi:hypothetical protein
MRSALGKFSPVKCHGVSRGQRKVGVKMFHVGGRSSVGGC